MPIAVNVLRKMKVEGAWRFLPVARPASGAARGDKFDWARVQTDAGVIVAPADAAFYLDYQDGGRRVRRVVGNHAREAKAAWATQANVLALRAKGVDVADAPQIEARRRGSERTGPTIEGVVSGFLKAPPLKLRDRSVAKYGNALKGFLDWTRKQTRKRFVDELGRADLMAYMAHEMMEKGLDRSTAVDKGVVVLSVMREVGAPIQMKKGDWARTTEREVEVYRPEVLKRLFAAAEPENFVLFQTFLLTGMRDQEVGYLAWSDFDERRSTLRVSKKAELGFDPKNYDERTVPVPSELVRLLVAHRKLQAANGAELLIFPTSRRNAHIGRPGGQRDKKMLARLKAIAWRAGLNCGRCRGTVRGKHRTCADAPICGEFGLHRFRHTYATTLLRGGVDIVSVQKLLGHRDSDSTRKYLRALEPDDLLAKINGTALATMFV